MINDRFKIRVFDTKNNCYLSEIEKTVACEDGTEFTFFAWVDRSNSTKYRILTFWNIKNSSRFILEQCTGLKDRNGKLIFEGDILQSMEYPSIIATMEWDAKEMCYTKIIPLPRFIIIGNIREGLKNEL